MDGTWPEFTVLTSTEFGRPRFLRRPGPALRRDAWGLRLWGFRMDVTGRDRAKVIAAALGTAEAAGTPEAKAAGRNKGSAAR